MEKVEERVFVTYQHHFDMVWVRKDLRGRHREFCLCYSCLNFNPGDPDSNCPLAEAVFHLNLKYGMTTPVWECPRFAEGK